MDSGSRLVSVNKQKQTADLILRRRSAVASKWMSDGFDGFLTSLSAVVCVCVSWGLGDMDNWRVVCVKRLVCVFF